ncbi:MAG: phosphomannomutase/phosphoglucomutase [Rhodovibrionaceae bacterium]|nr:phosphomannomutase/phosphoglucomutase [Rhodovibrionaceae bacterium]
MAGHRFDPSILREYDVRGVVGKTITEEDAYHLGRAFGTVLAGDAGSDGGSVALGRDGRVSSPGIAGAVARGLADCGLEVREIGVGPTPMLYYAGATLGVTGAVMVTGSHNPPDHNGFKLVRGGRSFFGSDIQGLAEIATDGAYADGNGERRKTEVFDDYIQRIARDYDGGKGLKVAWDAGNGAAGEAMSALSERLPGRHILLNAEIDGTFPNHHPDPTVPDNLAQLIQTVLDEGCDLGVAFDGDGDRLGAVDSQGRILWGDQLLLRLARDVLRESPGAKIIADVKSSQILFDGVEAAGGEPVMWKTGHSLIKTKMHEEGAPLAGEMSAHIFFADRYYGYDDALYAAVRLIGAIDRSGESLAAFRDSLPDLLNTPELRFPCAEDRKFAVIDEVRQRLSESDAEVVAIDGVRVRTEDGWWLLRASNTQDVLVARCEAKDEAGLKRLAAELTRQLEESGVEAPDL